MPSDATAITRFTTTLGTHPSPCLLVSADGVLAVNDAAITQFGFSQEALVAAGLPALTEDHGRWDAQIAPLLDGSRAAASWSGRLRQADGTREVSIEASGIQRQGTDASFVAVLRIDLVGDDDERRGEIRRLRQRYERLVDGAQEGIWEVDEAGITVFANPRMAEMLGCSVADLIGRPMLDFFDPDLADLVHAQFAVIQEGATDRFDARCRRLDGTEVRFMVSAIPLFDANGEPCGAAALAVDVTDRHRQEMELRSKEEILRRTFEGAPIGAALVDLDGTWIRVNEELCRIVGRDHDDLLAATFQDITHPDDLDADLELLRATVAGERTGYSMEKRYLRPDGAVVWVRLTVGLVRDDGGEPMFFVSQVEDITDSKSAEAAVEKALERMRRILERAAVPMALLYEDGSVHESNSQFRALFGNSAAPSSFLATVSAASRSALLSFLRDHSVDACEMDLDLADGSRTLRVMLSPLDDDDGPWIVQAIDVTVDVRERRQLERLSERDPLTGLLNRRGIERAATSGREDQTRLVAMYCDLDEFKQVNDRRGHDVGDRLLCDVADTLSSCVRTGDLVARLGGDEFAIVSIGGDLDTAAAIGRRVLEALADRLRRDGVTISIGVACGTVDDLDELLVDADRAMLDAKSRGKNQMVIA